jgi:2-methylcitrate dehydratase PrpD
MLAVYGAVTAAGKLLGLNEAQFAHAFGIAGSSASGLLAYDLAGGEVKRTHGALGARSGMQAAMLAKAGLTGPLPVFEGRHGWFEAFGGAAPAEPQKLFDDFGKPPYCITLCRYRVYSAIGTSHSPIDIIKDLMKQHAFKHTDVDSVRVGLYERGLHHTGAIKRPHDVISAQASMAYGVAIRLIKGSNTLEMYLDPKLWTDPEVLSLVDRVEGHVVAKPGAPRFTTVDIKLKNGQVLHGELDATPGSEESPFSDEIMAEKFRGLAEVMLPRQQVDAIMQKVNSLESMKSMAELAPLLQKEK